MKFTITEENKELVQSHMLETLAQGLKAGPVLVTLGRPTRNSDQNAKLHAMLADLSKQVEWHGQKLSVEVWKRLCVAAYLRDNSETPILVPALDGNGFDVIYEKTSKMSVKEMAELIEWIYMFAAECNVVWSERAKDI